MLTWSLLTPQNLSMSRAPPFGTFGEPEWYPESVPWLPCTKIYKGQLQKIKWDYVRKILTQSHLFMSVYKVIYCKNKSDGAKTCFFLFWENSKKRCRGEGGVPNFDNTISIQMFFIVKTGSLLPLAILYFFSFDLDLNDLIVNSQGTLSLFWQFYISAFFL